MRKFLFILLMAPLAALASSNLKLDQAPVNQRDMVSLQRGAHAFVNYCLNCHSASYMRYNQFIELGLTEEQIAKNLMFAADKVGEPMTVALRTADAKRWFGANPPDLSVIARSRGADWLYTYLRGFYRDESRPTGWNNVAFPQVGMPHVLWKLQGVQELEHHEAKGEAAHAAPPVLKLVEKGSMDKAQYDQFAGDLVNFLVYMGEPHAQTRKQVGIWVLLFLFATFPVVYLLKKEFWKDIH